MIAIVNVSPLDIAPLGEHEYVVKINAQEMARFRHCRSKGLAACLRAAADAVEREHYEKFHQITKSPTKNHEHSRNQTCRNRPR